MAPVSFVTYDRIRWVMKNLIQPRVKGNVTLTLDADGRWHIDIIEGKSGDDAEAKQHCLILGENEHELDLILDKFQNHKLEVRNGQIERVQRKETGTKSRRVSPISLDFPDINNPDGGSSFFD